MDLGETENALKTFFDENVGVKYTIENDGSLLELNSLMAADEFDDDISLSVFVKSGGLLLISMVFDKLPEPEKAYALINRFNVNQPILRAFINDDSRFEIQHAVLDAGEPQTVVRILDFILSRLFVDPFLSMLKEITALTVR